MPRAGFVYHMKDSFRFGLFVRSSKESVLINQLDGQKQPTDSQKQKLKKRDLRQWKSQEKIVMETFKHSLSQNINSLRSSVIDSSQLRKCRRSNDDVMRLLYHFNVLRLFSPRKEKSFVNEFCKTSAKLGTISWFPLTKRWSKTSFFSASRAKNGNFHSYSDAHAVNTDQFLLLNVINLPSKCLFEVFFPIEFFRSSSS